MNTRCFVLSFVFVLTRADVSHLAVTHNNHYGGYNYEPPTDPLDLPSATTFLPEIIVNKGFFPAVFDFRVSTIVNQ